MSYLSGMLRAVAGVIDELTRERDELQRQFDSLTRIVNHNRERMARQLYRDDYVIKISPQYQHLVDANIEAETEELILAGRDAEVD